MPRLEAVRRYDVPVERGFAFITDTANWPRYWPGYVRLEDDSRWGAVGDTARMVTRLLGRERELTMTITRFEPNRLVTYTSTQPGLPDARHERWFEADGAGFVYRLVVEYEPRPRSPACSTGCCSRAGSGAPSSRRSTRSTGSSGASRAAAVRRRRRRPRRDGQPDGPRARRGGRRVLGLDRYRPPHTLGSTHGGRGSSARRTSRSPLRPHRPARLRAVAAPRERPAPTC